MFKKILTTAAALGTFIAHLHASDLSEMSWDEIVAKVKNRKSVV